MKPDLLHTMVRVKDLDRSVRFYTEVLGLREQRRKVLEKADATFYGWDILLRAVRDVGSLSMADLKNLDASGVTVDARIRELQDALLRFSAALEFKDVARIAEIIDTEFRLRLHDWRSVIEALGRHVAKSTGNAV